MPRKNINKPYVENGYYHLYNRGNNKQPIFFEEKNYKYFLFLLKSYLSPISELEYFDQKNDDLIKYKHKNYFNNLKVLAFCLMPNHFHLLVKQTFKKTIADFMQSIQTNYVMYINKKYNRCGTLFQSTYRGILLEHQQQVLLISRYIHLNPANLNPQRFQFAHYWSNYEDYPFSSCAWYKKRLNCSWFNSSEILDFFYNKSFLTKNYKTYRMYVSKQTDEDLDDRTELLLDRVTP